jgi:hypothetical protein
MGRFLEYDHGRSVATKKFYPGPHHPSVSLMDVQKDFGENERDKDKQHGVELALLGFDCQEANQTHTPMINQWSCEQHRIREIGLLPLHVCKESDAR